MEPNVQSLDVKPLDAAVKQFNTLKFQVYLDKEGRLRWEVASK